MISIRNSIIIVLLLLAMTLSLWSILHSQGYQITASNSGIELADGSMENVSATIFNAQGKPALIIASPKMIHYAKNDVTEITKPKVAVLREPASTWHIDSLSAQATNGLNKIVFRDNVVATHQEDPSNPVTTLNTTTLTIYPDKETAETSAAVSLIQPSSIINAIGMLANLNDGTIKFLSKTRENYIPSPS